MNQIFSIDNRFIQLLNKIFCAAWLNILWFLCCIPVFTVGASTTALYYVSFKLVRNEEGNITKQFFTAFCSNFKKATLIWLPLLGLGILFGIDGYVLYHIRLENVFWTLCGAVLICAGVVYLIVLLNIFPLFARFENTIPATFKNALVMGLRYLFCSILMAVVYFVIYYVIINIFTPFVVFGQGLGALICAWLILPILERLENNEDDVL